MELDPVLSAQIAAFEQSYTDLFGEVPPLPKAKFDFAREVAPHFLVTAETLRAMAFYNQSFDTKTTQLMLFGMLLSQNNPAAVHHAKAALKAGATWDELNTVVELASVVSMLGPHNLGSSLLEKLKYPGSDQLH